MNAPDRDHSQRVSHAFWIHAKRRCSGRPKGDWILYNELKQEYIARDVCNQPDHFAADMHRLAEICGV